MSEPAAPGNVNIGIGGDLSGQLAVGNHITQVNASGGAVVYVLPEGKRPALGERERVTPVHIRPRPFPGLLDRFEALGSASAALQAGEPLQLLGPQGIGKSALLRRLSHEPITSSFRDGVVFLPSRNTTFDDLLNELYHAFYETDMPFRPTFTQVAEKLGTRHAVFVFDDITLAREDLERLLDAAPRSAFVFAMHERRLFGDARTITLDGLPEADGVALIERGLERSLEPGERGAAATLASALAGHPLRLLQQVAPVRDGSCTLEAVAENARDARSADALAGAALRRRPKRERSLLAVLAAFAGNAFAAEQAGAIAGVPDAAAAFDALARDGLAIAVEDRYEIAGNLGEAVRASVDLETVVARALEHYGEWVSRHSGDLASVLGESDILAALLEMAAEVGHWQGLMVLARGFEPALVLGGRWDAWRRVLDVELHAAQGLGDRAAEAWALHQIGSRAIGLGDEETARGALGEALEIREALGDRAGAEITRHNLQTLGSAPPAPEASGEVEVVPDPAPGVTGTGAAGATSMAKLVAGVVATALTLGATGYYLFLRPPAIALSSTSLIFDQTLLGAGSTRDLDVRNAGGEVLEVHDLRIDGTAAGDYRIGGDTCRRGSGIGRGQACALAVVFEPTAPGARHAELVLSSNAAGGTVRVALTGAGAPTPIARPAITLDSLALSFGERALGTRGAPRSLRLTNSGESPLAIASLGTRGAAGADFTLESGECTDGALAPGQGCTLTVAFAPVHAGERRASLVLESNATRGSVEVDLDGVGIVAARALTLEPARIDFGKVALGEARTSALVLRNPGPGAVTLARPRLAGANGFALLDGCELPALVAGASCTLSLRFAPATRGDVEATVVIETDAAQSPQRVELAGRTPAPPALALEVGALAFGEIEVGKRSTAQAVRVTNAGEAPLEIDRVSKRGGAATEFALESDRCSGTRLAMGQDCTLVLAFEPAGAGRRVATLGLPSNAPDAPGELELSGTGTHLPEPLTIEPARIDYGLVEPGNTRDVELTLRNRGGAPVSIGGVRLEGVSPHDFDLVRACREAVLAAGESCALTVRFAPRSPGDKQAAVVITTGAPGGPQRVALSGATPVETMPPKLSPSPLAFGPLPVLGTSLPKEILVENIGEAPLAIGPFDLFGEHPHDFSIQSDRCPASLPGGGHCMLVVYFSPTAAGPRSATVLVKDDAHGLDRGALLSGTGVASAAIGKLSVAPRDIGFDQVELGQHSVARRLTLHSVGKGPVEVGATQLVGVAAGEFHVTRDDCAAKTIAPGQRCVIDVTFAPGRPGLHQAAVAIVDTTGQRLADVPLQGAGTVVTSGQPGARPAFPVGNMPCGIPSGNEAGEQLLLGLFAGLSGQATQPCPPEGGRHGDTTTPTSTGLRSIHADRPVAVEFQNATHQTVTAYWIDYEGAEVFYFELQPGGHIVQRTFLTHPWRFRAGRQEVGVYHPTQERSQYHEIR